MIYKNALYLIIARYSTIPLSIATGILIARVLGPQGLGVFTLMFWLPGVLAGPMSLGIANANVYFGAQDATLLDNLFSNSIVITIFISIFVLLAIYFPLIYVNKFFLKKIDTIYLFIPFVGIPFRLIKLFNLNLLNAVEDHSKYRLIEILQVVIYTIFCFTVVFIFNLKIWGFVLSQIISTIITSLLSIIYISKHCEISLFNYDYNLLKSSISYGIKIQITSILRVFSRKFDEIIIVFVAGIDSLGVYSLVRNIINKLIIIPQSLGVILTPAITKSDNKIFITANTSRKLLFLILIISIFLFFFLSPIIPLIYGKEFESSVLLFKIFVIILLPFSLHRVLSSFFNAVGNPEIVLKSSIYNAILIIILDLLLIPKLSIYGAALSAIIAFLFDALYLCLAFVRQKDVSLGTILFVNKKDLIELIRPYKLIK